MTHIANTRIAIVGGGLSGLTAAYEFEQARQAGTPLDWQLFEASGRLGGIIETTRLNTAEGEYLLEGGPDGWVTEKPWARDLAIELGLGDDLIFSNDSTRRTYIYLDGQLQAIPDRMRLMVPEDLQTLEQSPLFSPAAQQAYAGEIARAEELKASTPFSAPEYDESVADFVLRHFGDEVLEKLAAPLLSGVFGGDVNKLSARAVMPQFVSMERQHGSLIVALQQARRDRHGKPQKPIFSSLRRGMASLVEALVATLPPERLHIHTVVRDIGKEPRWRVRVDQLTQEPASDFRPVDTGLFDHVLLATPLDATRRLLQPGDGAEQLQSLLPADASSAVLISFTWPAELADTLTLPAGFGFLVAHQDVAAEAPGPPQLLACTFADQKFSHRAPAGAAVLRAFFGSAAAAQFAHTPDPAIAAAALEQLAAILGPLLPPTHAEVRRWPRSLPQYEVGHLARVHQLQEEVTAQHGLTLLGSSYHGVGLPDLVRDARHAARRLSRAIQAASPAS